jgi:hypothetical protein
MRADAQPLRASLPALPPRRLLNPFRAPDDCELPGIRDRERRERAAPAAPAGRAPLRALTRVAPPRVPAEEAALAQLILAPDAPDAREGLRDFIGQKREIFLAQLGADAKRAELGRLERAERAEQASLAQKDAEIALFQEQFRAFLDDDQRSLADARRAAEARARQRDEVAGRIRAVSAQNAALRGDIASSEERLQECELFRAFVDALTPADWRARHPPPEPFFTRPQQMLALLQSLEEQNMFLIQHCQEAEAAVERAKAAFARLLDARDGAIAGRRAEEAERRARLALRNAQGEQFRAVGDFRHGNEIPDAELSELCGGVAELHAELGFDAAATGDAVMRLKRLEDRMEQLFVALASKAESVVKEKFSERLRRRRDHERAEKTAKTQKEQEEKMMRALQLATMPIKRVLGRPLMPRSCPTHLLSRERREEQLRLEEAQREADQDLLFGPIWD